MDEISISIFPTQGNEKSNSLTLNSVWDKVSEGGMRVAMSGEHCPIFKDKLPHKSVTLICNKEQYKDVLYWVGYCGSSVSKKLELNHDKLALRADYQCW